MSFRTIRLWPEPQPLDSVMSDICKRSRHLNSSMHRRGMLCLCEGHEIRPPLPPAATGHRPPDQLEALEQKCLLLRRSSKGQITFQSGRLHLWDSAGPQFIIMIFPKRENGCRFIIQFGRSAVSFRNFFLQRPLAQRSIYYRNKLNSLMDAMRETQKCRLTSKWAPNAIKRPPKWERGKTAPQSENSKWRQNGVAQLFSKKILSTEKTSLRFNEIYNFNKLPRETDGSLTKNNFFSKNKIASER